MLNISNNVTPCINVTYTKRTILEYCHFTINRSLYVSATFTSILYEVNNPLATTFLILG